MSAEEPYLADYGETFVIAFEALKGIHDSHIFGISTEEAGPVLLIRHLDDQPLHGMLGCSAPLLWFCPSCLVAS